MKRIRALGEVLQTWVWCAVLVASAAQAAPRVVVHPLVLVEPVKSSEEYVGAFAIEAARQSIDMVGSSELEAALATRPGRACDEGNECLAALARQTRAQYALWVTAEFVKKGFLMGALIVDAEGKVVQRLAPTVFEADRKKPRVPAFRVALKRLFEGLKLGALPDAAVPAAVVEAPPARVEPVRAAPAPVGPTAAAAAPPPVAETKPMLQPSPVAPLPAQGPRFRAPAWATAGLAVVAAGVGVGLLVSGNAAARDARGKVQNGAVAQSDAAALESAVASARTQQTMGVAGLGVAAASAAVSATLFLLGNPSGGSVAAVALPGGAWAGVSLPLP